VSVKFKLHENRTGIKGNLHEDKYTFRSYLAQFFLEWKNISEKKFVENIKNTRFMFNNRAVHEIILTYLLTYLLHGAQSFLRS